MNGAPSIPLNIPLDQLPFVRMHTVPPQEPGEEDDTEIYDTRTGVAISQR